MSDRFSAQPANTGHQNTVVPTNTTTNDSNNNNNGQPAAAATSTNDNQLTVPHSQIALQEVSHHVSRKARKRGLEFTMIVVGESGLGKSTLINCLFAYEIKREHIDIEKLINRTVSIDRHCLEIQEKGVKLRLTLIDTPGYGDALDVEKSFLAVESYIEDQFKQYFKDECGFNRKNIQDNRVDCCLYMISSCGKGLSALDKEFMLRLHNKVNIVPCIAKADALTADELVNLKQTIRDEINQLGVNIFVPPSLDDDDDPYSLGGGNKKKSEYEAIKQCLPFAIVSSMTAYEVNGKIIRGRLYPFGIVDIHDPLYDFDKLRIWLQDFMQDLRDRTNDVLYENYRTCLLSNIVQHNYVDPAGSAPPSTAIANVAMSEQLYRKQEELRRTQAQLLCAQERLQALSKVSLNE